MCSPTSPVKEKSGTAAAPAASSAPATSEAIQHHRRRRTKRTKQTDVLERLKNDVPLLTDRMSSSEWTRRRISRAKAKHGTTKPSGGVDALLPSLAIIGVLFFAALAKMGFRGRADVAGIDLGTTNSVVCVQRPSGGVGKIECIPDPFNNSPIVPSVVSFLDRYGPKMEPKVLVGAEAKMRIDTHPLHTVYHAKRVIGRPYQDDASKILSDEVEFKVVVDSNATNTVDGMEGVAFRIPHSMPSSAEGAADGRRHLDIPPQQVGKYIVRHLIDMAKNFLGHENVKSAVIAIPAKFSSQQRIATAEAFTAAGIRVARILEEPTAAALAYGLDKKDGVNHIMVYDFGGGTLDVSVLHVSDGGYVDVMGSDGDNQLGGADFDAAVARALLDKDGISDIMRRVTDSLLRIEARLKDDGVGEAGDDLEEMLTAGCPVLKEQPSCTFSSFHTIGEKVKIGLSAYAEGGGIVEQTCLGLTSETKSLPETISDFCSSLKPVTLSLTSAEYDAAVEDLYKRAMLPVRHIISDLNLRKDEIDEVVMVGGTTRMPNIRAMVREELDVEELNTHIDPDLTVAYGAASVID